MNNFSVYYGLVYIPCRYRALIDYVDNVSRKGLHGILRSIFAEQLECLCIERICLSS